MRPRLSRADGGPRATRGAASRCAPRARLARRPPGRVRRPLVLRRRRAAARRAPRGRPGARARPAGRRRAWARSAQARNVPRSRRICTDFATPAGSARRRAVRSATHASRRPPRRARRAPRASPARTSRGPWPVGQYAARLRDRLRALARVQVFGEVFNLRAGRARVWFELRDARGALPCSMWREDFDALAVAARRRHARRRRRRLRLLPRLARGVARLLLRGRPTCGSPARATCSPSSTSCAARCTPRACSSRRSGCRAPALPRCIGVVTGEGGKARDDVLAGLRRRGWAGRLVWAFAPVQDRHAAPAVTRALQDLAACPEVDVDHRRPRRRLARRPVRVLRRDAVPDRRAAARAGHRVGRPPHRPDADRRRRRRLVLDAHPRRRGGRARRLRRGPRAAARLRRAARAPGPPRDRRARADARAALARARHARRPPPRPACTSSSRELRASARRGLARGAPDRRRPAPRCMERRAAAAAARPRARRRPGARRRRGARPRPRRRARPPGGDARAAPARARRARPAAHARARLRARRGPRRARRSPARRRRAHGRG